MAKRFKYTNIFSTLVVVATIVFIFYFAQESRFLIFRNLRGNISYLFLIALVYVVGRVLDGLRLNVMAEAFSLKLKRTEWLGLSFIVPYYSLIIPKGGTIANAAYLKVKHNFTFEKFASFASGGLLLTFLVNGFFGIITVFICVIWEGKPGHLWFLSLFITIFTGANIMMCMPRKGLFYRYKFLSKINSILQGWKNLRSNRSTVMKLLILQVGILASFALRYYFAFKIFTSGVSYWSVFASSSVTYIANLLSIIPGNLGLREFVISFGAHFMGETIKNGALVSIVDRSVITLISCAFGFYYHTRLMKSVDSVEKEALAEKVMITHD
jgi:uncharacterized membrane protein YbhN (UPF0104 family)